jgi:hypothetical protein
MQDIPEKLKSLAGQAGEGLNKGIDVLKDKSSKVGDYLQANPTIAAMLLAGGGSGLLSGYLTSQQEEEGESKGSRRGRILRNALLAAAAGAGTVGLGAEGFKRLAEATPADSVNPVQEKLTSPVARGLGGVGAGALAFMKGRGLDKLVTTHEARSHLSSADQKAYKGASPDEVIAAAAKKQHFSPNPSGFVNPSIRRSPILDKALKALVGTSRAGQLARGGAAAGLLLPELIGSVKDLVLQND